MRNLRFGKQAVYKKLLYSQYIYNKGIYFDDLIHFNIVLENDCSLLRY